MISVMEENHVYIVIRLLTGEQHLLFYFCYALVYLLLTKYKNEQNNHKKTLQCILHEFL